MIKVSKQFIAATKEFSTYEHHVPAPLFRRSFNCDKDVANAVISVCGLGFYEFFFNGKSENRSKLAPYISNPDHKVYYDTYDLTSEIRKGKNTLGFILGNGFLNNPGGTVWDFQYAPYRSAPKLAVCLVITYCDGTKEEITSDGKFLTHPSHILFDDIRCGEIADGRLEVPDFSSPDLDDSDWTPAIPAETPWGAVVTESYHDPIVVSREIKPVSVKPGKITYLPDIRGNLPQIYIPESDMTGYIYDFGVNSAGVMRLRVKGKPGQRIVMQCGEFLADDGGLDLRNMNFQPLALNQVAIYTCRGDGIEEFTPRFTYFGYRYVLVSGITEEQATEDLLEYLEMHSDLPKNGDFTCSDGIVNRLQAATVVANYANFYYFPTDCPHREKNGWTGDACDSCEEMMINMRPERSYREWLRNIVLAQKTDGSLPGIVPTSGWGFSWGNGPGWDSVLVTLPYNIWKYRGDTDPFCDVVFPVYNYLHYMMTKEDKNGLFHYGLGDWCPPCSFDGDAPLKVTDTIICMVLAKHAAELYRAVGQEDFAVYAEGLYTRIRTNARRELILDDGKTVFGNCQTCQAMAIRNGLFEPEEIADAYSVLLDIVRRDNFKLTCGILGCRDIFEVLADNGNCEIAYDMIRGPEFPSFGYTVEVLGCTALPEQIWLLGNCPPSCNHHFFGVISAFFYRELAGIRVNDGMTSPNEVVISPRFIDRLDYAEGRINLPAGEIVSRWERQNGSVVLTVTVPDGASATLDCGGRHEKLKTGKNVIEF